MGGRFQRDQKSRRDQQRDSHAPEQTDIVLFIIDTPGYTMNSVAKQAVAAKSLSPVDTARVFALMHMAGDDAGFAVFEAMPPSHLKAGSMPVFTTAFRRWSVLIWDRKWAPMCSTTR